MADARLHRLLQARTTTSGDDVFGETELITDNKPVRRAPIQRVAILTESFLPKLDGVSKTTYLTVRYLQETGREVLIFAPDSAVPAVGPSEVVNLPSFSLPSITETRVAIPNPYLARRIEMFQPDLIHLASPAIMTVTGMAVGREYNIPVVANYQTDLPGYAAHYGWPILSDPIRNWLRYLHNGCHINLVPSQTIADDLREHGFHRLRVWGRGVNIQRFHPDKYSDEMRQQLLNGRDADSLLLLYVGRLANEKRVDLLRGVADVAGVALTIIGDGHSRESLEKQFAGTNTHFMGYMQGDHLARAFASADAFFFPGPNETFGQVVQEAMASGLPTIVTNQGSVKDLVHDGITGFVVEHDARSFAQAAQHLQQNRALVAKMSANARTIAEERPWSAIMEQLEDHYQEAISINRRFKTMWGRTFYHQPLAFGARLQQLNLYNPAETLFPPKDKA